MISWSAAYIICPWVDRPKNHLTSIDYDALTIEVIREKLNHRYEKKINKDEEEKEKENALANYSWDTKADAVSVVSMVIHQLNWNVLKIK